MPALTPKADTLIGGLDVRFVPEADMPACRPKPHSLLKSLDRASPKKRAKKMLRCGKRHCANLSEESESLSSSRGS